MDPVARKSVTRIEAGVPREMPDALTVEEPLEIRLNGAPIAVVMRTPGDDIHLAAGFMLTEGILPSPEAIGSIAHCSDAAPESDQNIVNVIAAEGIAVDAEKFRRNFFASSSCGLCGKATIDAIRLNAPPLHSDWHVSATLISDLITRLASGQRVFAETGSLHAAGLFLRDGSAGPLAEDVGRHNAVDKVIGRASFAGDWPLSNFILCISGRISFEIAQKAAMAGIPIIAAVSGASSLAVEVAQELGMTLVGFVRGESMTLYCGESVSAT